MGQENGRRVWGKGTRDGVGLPTSQRLWVEAPKVREDQAAISSQLLPGPHSTLLSLPTLSLLAPTPIWTWHHSL